MEVFKKIDATQACKEDCFYIHLSIGLHSDETWSKAFSIENCHVLYRRPWLERLGAIHNLETYAHELSKDKTKIHLRKCLTLRT